MSSPLAEIGSQITRARLKAGFTQLELAHLMGHSGDDAGAYISRLENGFHEPRLGTLIRIAEALSVPLESLLPA